MASCSRVIVLDLMLQGCTTNQMALQLHRSRRTIEMHRSHIMRKLGAVTAVDLMKAASARGYA